MYIRPAAAAVDELRGRSLIDIDLFLPTPLQSFLLFTYHLPLRQYLPAFHP
jgi:hypothetical protein